MRQGFNDDQNNPRFNFVPHPVTADAERGIPVVNKIVSRTDDPGVVEICVDVEPDPTLYGGGTWQPIGGRYKDIPSVTLQQGGSLAITVTYARYRFQGNHVDIEAQVSMQDGETPTPGSAVKVFFNGMGIDVANQVGESAVHCGTFMYAFSKNGWLLASSPSTSVELEFVTDDGFLGDTDGFELEANHGLWVSAKFEATAVPA